METCQRSTMISVEETWRGHPSSQGITPNEKISVVLMRTNRENWGLRTRVYSVPKEEQFFK